MRYKYDHIPSCLFIYVTFSSCPSYLINLFFTLTQTSQPTNQPTQTLNAPKYKFHPRTKTNEHNSTNDPKQTNTISDFTTNIIPTIGHISPCKQILFQTNFARRHIVRAYQNNTKILRAWLIVYQYIEFVLRHSLAGMLF